MNQERKVVSTKFGQLTHWSRTPFDMTPACGSKGIEWSEAIDARTGRPRNSVSCYKCQRKHGRG